MAKSAISMQEAKLYLLLRESPKTWLTSKELATTAEVSGACTRMYLRRFVKAGIAEVIEIFPGYRYRISALARRSDPVHVSRLESAVDVLGFVRSTET